MPKLAGQIFSGSATDDRQSDLSAIAYAMGGSRKFLQNRQRWYEACRDPKEYRPLSPYILEDEMLSDACRTVARCGTEAEKAAVRSAVQQYMDTRLQLVLEPLASVHTTDVLKLCTDEIKEGAEAAAAVTTALSTKSAADVEAAERETLEASTAMERLRQGLRGLIQHTPRTNRLFAGVR